MRLFAAVYPPPEAVNDLTAQVARLRVGAAAAAGGNVRLADPAHVHVTVAFLGHVPPDRLVAVESALGLAVAQIRNGHGAAPRLALGGGGRFGQGRSTVLWVDLRGEVKVLHALAGEARTRLLRAGLPHDDRPFQPHLTIARPGDQLDPADVDRDRDVLAGYLGPVWPATELVLVRSHLGPSPRYDRLAAWPL